VRDGFVVLAEGLHMLRLEATAAGGNMNPSGYLSFTKRTLYGNLGLEPRGWDRFG
jgi:hypothetical protein